MAMGDEADIHALIQKEHGVDTRSLEFQTVSNQTKALITDVNRVRSYPLLNEGVVVGGAIYDVATGKITPVDC
jgi:carbonic anhydrase